MDDHNYFWEIKKHYILRKLFPRLNIATYKEKSFVRNNYFRSQPFFMTDQAFTCSKSAIATLEKGAKYV